MLRRLLWTALVQNIQYDLERERRLLWLTKPFVFITISSNNLNWRDTYAGRASKDVGKKGMRNAEVYKWKVVNKNSYIRLLVTDTGGQLHAIREPKDMLLSYSKFIPSVLLHLLHQYPAALNYNDYVCTHLNLPLP